MTDNMTSAKIEKTGSESLLNIDDEKLLESFFADCRMDIPDDGFSDRVMNALPVADFELSHADRRLEHLWTAVCVAVGIVAAFVCQGWEQIQCFLYSMKIDFLLSGSHALTHVVEALAQSHNLWMTLLGGIVLLMVWGYSELMDARQ